MKNMKQVVLSLAGIFLSFISYSQEYLLTGKLVDGEDNTPLVGATIMLTHTTDSSRHYTITDTEGYFNLNQPKTGPYLLKVSYIGYNDLILPVKLTSEKQDLGILQMQPKTELLKEVVVAGTMQRATQEGDTTSYNAEAFKTTNDASAEDLIRKMPGVMVQDGKVQAQGEDVQRVLVDGKEFFDNDATLALRNLPAEVIDKIQVFDRQSEQAQFTGFDDGNAQKTINIVTKPGMRNGEFGRIYSGYGYEDKYMLGGNYNIFSGDRRISILGLSNNLNQQNFSSEDLLGVTSASGNGGRRGGRGGRGGGGGNSAGNFLVGQQNGITTTQAFGVNYTDNWSEKIEVSGSYFFNMTENKVNQSLIRDYFLSSDTSLQYLEENRSGSRNTNHRFSLRMEYNIDPNNSLVFTPRLSLQSNERDEWMLGMNTTGSTIPENRLETTQASDNFGYNYSGNLLFRHRFTKPRRTLSVGIETGLNRNNGEQYLDTYNALNAAEATPEDSIRRFSDSWSGGYTLGANVAYTEPVGQRGMLMFNYDANYQDNGSEKNTSLWDDEREAYLLTDTLLSNIFYNDYLTQRLGTSYRLRSKGIMVAVGMQYQHASLVGEQEFPLNYQLEKSFSNLLPNAMLRYDLSKDKNLRLSYRTNTSPPGIGQMQPVLDVSNPLQLRAGNPALKQELRHNVFLRYNANNVEKASTFFALIGGSHTQDFIGNTTFIAVRDTLLAENVQLQRGGQLSGYANLDGNWSARAFLTYGMPVEFLKSNLNTNVSFNYSRLPGIINGETNYSNTYSNGLGVALSSNISERIDFTLSTTSTYNIVQNTLQRDLDQNYFSQRSYVKLKWISNSGWLIESELNHQIYRGLSDDIDQDYSLWNIGIGKKLFKDQRGELKLSLFDVLNKNNNIQRNVTESYTEDVMTNVLNRYALVTFTYDLRRFGKR